MFSLPLNESKPFAIFFKNPEKNLFWMETESINVQFLSPAKYVVQLHCWWKNIVQHSQHDKLIYFYLFLIIKKNYSRRQIYALHIT